MKSGPNNIHPVFDRIQSREAKENRLNQKSKAIWLTGLSGSGKSTIAIALEKKLMKNNFFCKVLDGDNIRAGINKNLGFSDEDRTENIRRIAEVSKLFIDCGIITINSFVSPTNEIRSLAQNIIGKNDFIEVYINVPLKIAEERDVKGLYKKAREGEIKDFTGIGSGFEEPENPEIIIKTNELSIEESTNKLYQEILKNITAD